MNAKGLSHDKIIDLLCCQQDLTKQGQHLPYLTKTIPSMARKFGAYTIDGIIFVVETNYSNTPP